MDQDVHELIFYLQKVQEAMVDPDIMFAPQFLIVAVSRPDSDALELMVNMQDIDKKIGYILDTYDHATGAHKNNAEIILQQLMVV